MQKKQSKSDIFGQQSVGGNPQINSDKASQLKLIVTIIFWGFIAAVIFNFIYQGSILRKPYPYNTFLFLPSDRFNDFFNNLIWCKTLNPYFAPSYLGNGNYLPLANIIFWIFTFMSKQLSLYVYIGLFSALIYLFSYIFIPKTVDKLNRHKYAFVISFLSYGYLVSFDRANLEPYVAILIMAFLFFYLKKQHQIAILFLAFAAATKIYPAIFVLLYVSDKKYKEVTLTLFYMVILIILPLFAQQRGFEENMYFIMNGFELDLNTPSFFGAFDDTGNQMLQGTSLFSVFKLLNIKMKLVITNMLGKYFIIVGLIALITIAYVVLVEKVLWRKVTLLTCLIIVLPHISFDYKFIHFLFCIYLFINESKNEVDSKLNYKTIAIIFGLLLIPKAYFYFSKIVTTTSGQNDVPMGTLINPLLMLYLCYIIIKSGMKHYKISAVKSELKEHTLAIKKSLVFILPLCLLVIPYYSFSKKAKAEYGKYKAHYLGAQDYLSKNEKQKAITELDSAFKYKPYKFQLPLQIANLYNVLGNFDSSRIYFNKTLLIFPECYEAKNGIVSIDINGNNAKGVNALNNKNYSEAIIDFNKALEAFNKLPPNPDNKGFLMSLHSNLYTCNVNLQKWNEAKINLDQIAAIDPNNQFVSSNMSYISKMIEVANK